MVVQSAASQEFMIDDSVFQGTVLVGPPPEYQDYVDFIEGTQFDNEKVNLFGIKGDVWSKKSAFFL